MVTGLSDSEFEVLSDSKFLLAKRDLSDKIIKKLQQVEESLKETILASDFPFPKGTFTKSGKISKGENYKGLPYFVLDFPRLFTRKSTFAYRTMLWWGHEISFTMHVQDECYHQYINLITAKFSELSSYYICVNNTPWEYDFSPQNYQLVSEVAKYPLGDLKLDQKQFCKLSTNVSLNEFDSLQSLASDHLIYYLNILKS